MIFNNSKVLIDKTLKSFDFQRFFFLPKFQNGAECRGGERVIIEYGYATGTP